MDGEKGKLVTCRAVILRIKDPKLDKEGREVLTDSTAEGLRPMGWTCSWAQGIAGTW